jgi:hypothetical protein
MNRFRRFLALAGCLTLGWTGSLHAQAAGTAAPGSLLARHYREGETLRYHMRATHRSSQGLVRYEADATGRVVRDSLGRYFEALEWSQLVENDRAVTLPGGTAPVHQRLTLEQDYVLPPDVAHADPRLIGPLLDLYTFYVDLRLATESLALARPGDHVRVPGRGANSWADDRHVLVGEDAIDFVITLESVDSTARVARVLVQHVPPTTGRVTLPADWMKPRLGAEPNNWVQVSAAQGGFTAGVGRETFDVWLTVSLADGKLLSATMDNPVEVLEWTCADRALTQCGTPVRSEIRRRIWLDLVPGS